MYLYLTRNAKSVESATLHQKLVKFYKVFVVKDILEIVPTELLINNMMNLPSQEVLI